MVWAEDQEFCLGHVRMLVRYSKERCRVAVVYMSLRLGREMWCYKFESHQHVDGPCRMHEISEDVRIDAEERPRDRALGCSGVWSLGGGDQGEEKPAGETEGVTSMLGKRREWVQGAE